MPRKIGVLLLHNMAVTPVDLWAKPKAGGWHLLWRGVTLLLAMRAASDVPGSIAGRYCITLMALVVPSV